MQRDFLSLLPAPASSASDVGRGRLYAFGGGSGSVGDDAEVSIVGVNWAKNIARQERTSSIG